MKRLLLLPCLLLLHIGAPSQIPASLPDPLLFKNGKKVSSLKQWPARRQEILDELTHEMYGVMPPRPTDVRYQVFDNDKNALGGKATRRQVTVHIREKDREASFDVLIYIPNKIKHPVPTIVGINFGGNQTINSDPAIKISTAWTENGKNAPCAVNGKATEACRGINASMWPVDSILDAGFALATLYREETKGFPYTTFPALNEPLWGRVGYHIRPGGHDVKMFDWKQYLNFSNLQLKK